MSFERGGRADKLGNRYEGRWVAKQLLRLLNEEIVSVTIEAIGDDEYGVDLWIVRRTGYDRLNNARAEIKVRKLGRLATLKQEIF